MPFVVGEGDPAWDNQPEDGDFVFKAVDFQYVDNISDLARPPGPLRFSLDVPAPPMPPSLPTVAAPTPSLLDRLLGRTPRALPPPAASDDFMQRFEFTQRQTAYEGQRFFAAITPALRAAGVSAAYCRYDGGNDEGFSYFGHYLSSTGEVLELDAVTARLATTDMRARLQALHSDRKAAPTAADLGEEIALEGAVMLNGSGYGNGPYMLYGAFTVDFNACTISDDPNAAPRPEADGIER
jgi:hypothetical protein